jgi:hypothetical protein
MMQMGIYLNCDNEGFQICLNDYIYVDHSLLIEYTNDLIGRRDRYICVSRPRRFGKSTDANMLVAYYSKGCDSSSLFDDLKVSQIDSYQTHLNKHNVIKIDMQYFLTIAEDINDFFELFNEEIIEELNEIYDIKARRNILPLVLSKIYAKTNDKFIFIIDEWDSVLRQYKDDKDIQRKYLDYLSALLKDKDYVSLVYMTGILPIRKYGNESVINMFKEITFIHPTPLEKFTGFTEEEVKQLCKQCDMSFEAMKDWYNGYRLDNNLSVYNPRSVVYALTDKKYGNYWTGTQTYEMLKGYLNEYDLREDVLELLEGKEVIVNTSLFQNNISSFQSKDDVLTLLVHLGYLGYNSENKSVYIPNKEVKDEFVTAIQASSWGFITKLAKNSQELLEATINMDEEKVSKYLEVIHDDVESKQYNSEYALSAVINIAYIAARDDYMIIQELPSGKGYADIAYIPKPGIHKPAMVIELKYEQDVETAIDQIKKKNYPKKLEHYLDNLLLVGINYNKDKEHECIIERYTK